MDTTCAACAQLPAGSYCLSHTCADCGQLALTVHGLNGEPCPAPKS